MKKFDLTRYTPPGREPGSLLPPFLPVVAVTFLLLFLFDYSGDLRALFLDGVLLPDVQIRPFQEFMETPQRILRFIALIQLSDIYSRWSYYRRDSRADYLMKRLPDGGLMWRTCWVVPVCQAAVVMLFSLVYTGICYAIYISMTPPACLPGV